MRLMAEAPPPQVPIFLDRDGMIPGPSLLAGIDRPGLGRTVTAFGQGSWLVTPAEDVRTVRGHADLFTTGTRCPSSATTIRITARPGATTLTTASCKTSAG